MRGLCLALLCPLLTGHTALATTTESDIVTQFRAMLRASAREGVPEEEEQP